VLTLPQANLLLADLFFMTRELGLSSRRVGEEQE
jgi:hypothetical protein